MDKVVPVNILLVEDNEDDILLINEALEDSKFLNIIDVVENGVEALDYLRKKGIYKSKKLPGLILLDINMPKKNGFETLDEIKEDVKLKHIPVVMLTVSKAETDILKSYSHGACTYINKPVDFEKLKEVVKQFELYWTLVAKIPDSKENE